MIEDSEDREPDVLPQDDDSDNGLEEGDLSGPFGDLSSLNFDSEIDADDSADQDDC